MPTTAGGLAKILSEVASSDYRFIVRTGLVFGSPIGSQTLESTWARDGSTNEAEWQGANPEITNTDESDKTARFLEVRYGTGAGEADRIVIIALPDVVLSQNDTIEFTSVKIEFNTTD